MTPPELPSGPAPGADLDSTRTFIAWTLERFADRRTALTTSFGMEGCVLIDLYASTGRPLTVWYMDTGFFFPETLALRDRMIARYPQLSFVDRGTALSPAQQSELFGPALWQTDPDLCCHLRKVAPMQQAMRDADVWVTAITRSQSATRAETPALAWDDRFRVIKVSPLIHWDRTAVWTYAREHGVPYNPLHERGYASIGCTHCTQPVAGLTAGQYSRAGRWRESGKTECGLHGPIAISSSRR